MGNFAFITHDDNVATEWRGSASASYAHSDRIDEPLMRQAGGANAFFLRDAQGSVLALADGTGAVSTGYAYSPFGNTSSTGATDDNAFQYTGREKDGTGLYYYRARYYSPELGRFVSEDPIGFRGGDANLYGYVANRPINLVDSYGLEGGYWSRVGSDMRTTSSTLAGRVAQGATSAASSTWGVPAATGLSAGGSLYMTAAFWNAGMASAAIITGIEATAAIIVNSATVAKGWVIGTGIGSMVNQLPVVGGGTVGDWWVDWALSLNCSE